VGHTSVIDDANGIMAISSDSNSATGIGIQLSSSNTTLQPMTFSQPTTALVSGTDATDQPLYARYIKTGAAVTPGPADETDLSDRI
jgi:type 1 fimbria pilin